MLSHNNNKSFTHFIVIVYDSMLFYFSSETIEIAYATTNVRLLHSNFLSSFNYP
jgi:hypothetical protein